MASRTVNKLILKQKFFLNVKRAQFQISNVMNFMQKMTNEKLKNKRFYQI